MSSATTKRTVADRIRRFSPCADAIDWASKYASADKAWQECRRGDWMLWLLGKQAGPPESDGRKRLVLAACECARLALPHTKNARALTCIETAERWAHGQATIEQLRESRNAAYADADAAYVYDAADAYDAANAAYAAAYAAANAAYAAANAACAYVAAYDAAYAAYAADDDAAQSEVLSKCAAIVRQHYPKAPIIKD